MREGVGCGEVMSVLSVYAMCVCVGGEGLIRSHIDTLSRVGGVHSRVHG